MQPPALRLLFGAVLSAVCVAACTGTGVETRMIRAQEIPPQWIYVGMKKEKVIQRIGPPLRIVGTKEFPDGVMEILHYVVNRVSYLEDTGSKKEYFFYIWNGELVRWDRPDEWEAEVERLHESAPRK